MLGVSYVMTFYVDACALVYFQFHSRSVGRSVGRSVCLSVDPGTTSRHFGAETKIRCSESTSKVSNINIGVSTPKSSLESRLSKGGGGREKRAWYPAIAHALECART